METWESQTRESRCVDFHKRGVRDPRLIEVLPAQKYRISELLKQQCKVLNSTAIASGYAGRDPQGGTSDRSFLVSVLLRYKGWLKFFFQFL